MRHAVDPFRFGDVVIARKDMPTSYHLAVVVDDAYQQVSLVTRGEDLLLCHPYPAPVAGFAQTARAGLCPSRPGAG